MQKIKAFHEIALIETLQTAMNPSVDGWLLASLIFDSIRPLKTNSIRMKQVYFQNTITDENHLKRLPSSHLSANYSLIQRFVFFIFLFVWVNSLNAQISVNNTMAEFKFEKISHENDARYSEKISEIQGTPYLDKEFISGNITTIEGNIISDVPLRYNGCTDDLEFLKGDEHYVVDPKTSVKKAEFGGKVFSCLQYDMNGKTQSGFFVVLTEGKAILLVKYTMRFFEKEPAKPFTDPKPARFDAPVKEYFIAFDGAPAKLIINKRKFIDLFGNQKDEMESYITKNKLSIRDDDALTKIVLHYNTL